MRGKERRTSMRAEVEQQRGLAEVV